jgi:hypothetical protein
VLPLVRNRNFQGKGKNWYQKVPPELKGGGKKLYRFSKVVAKSDTTFTK